MPALFFLSGGLILGWSHGANNAGNVFGTAIGSGMIRFRTAAIVTGVFMILGAAISGAGASETLGRLGSINEIAGAFMVALSAAFTMIIMTRLKLPVSTSQTIVGSIIGWNYYSGSLTDYDSLVRIVSSWIAAPVISAVFAVAVYILIRFLLGRIRIHLLQLDLYNRIGLVLAGAFGAYSLGANNIANVMGVFIPVSPFRPVDTGIGLFTSVEQLFALGGLAMAAGVLTYSYRIMKTVGRGIMPLTPITAFAAVLASSTVLFLFSSRNLEMVLGAMGLPTIPLVPVSSSQAIVGAIIGIGFFQGGRVMNYRLLGKIASGWVTAPVMACIMSFVSLFFLQNVFSQQVYRDVRYSITGSVAEKIESEGILLPEMENLKGLEFKNAMEFRSVLEFYAPNLGNETLMKIIRLSQRTVINVNMELVSYEISQGLFTWNQLKGLESLDGQTFFSTWQFSAALTGADPEWRMKEDVPENREYNDRLRQRIEYLVAKFSGMR